KACIDPHHTSPISIIITARPFVNANIGERLENARGRGRDSGSASERRDDFLLISGETFRARWSAPRGFAAPPVASGRRGGGLKARRFGARGRILAFGRARKRGAPDADIKNDAAPARARRRFCAMIVAR